MLIVKKIRSGKGEKNYFFKKETPASSGNLMSPRLTERKIFRFSIPAHLANFLEGSHEVDVAHDGQGDKHVNDHQDVNDKGTSPLLLNREGIWWKLVVRCNKRIELILNKIVIKHYTKLWKRISVTT